MFSLARRRREAERHKKLEDQFNKADTSGNGKITAEQMVKIFEDNEVVVPNLEEEVAKLPDKEGWITMNDFKKYAIGNSELCKVEFVDRVFQKSDPDEDRKQKEAKATKVKLDPSKMDRIELAFRKFDLNHDGFLSRDEFDQMMKNVSKEQADRIFRTCDTNRNNKISLEEFRAMLDRDPAQASTSSKDPSKVKAKSA